MESKWFYLSIVFFVGLGVAMFSLEGVADRTEVVPGIGVTQEAAHNPRSYVGPRKPEAMSRETPSRASRVKARRVPHALDPTIWDNGGPAVPWRILSSQKDTCYPFISQTADDIMFTQDMAVTDVHWWARFWNGPPDSVDPCNFRIYFYADDGTGNAPTGGGMADPSPTALAYYYFPGVSGLPLDPDSFYEYHVDLEPPFSAAANVKYWIAIQADYCFPPQWGWAATEAIQLHSAVQGMPIIPTPFWTDTDPAVDMAFYLTGAPEEEPWPNHKMHFPQLPDLIGWDVNATYPKTLADDWQCSQTGPVEDIHFWGSWKDQDGIPETDDIGNILYFIFSIHSNLPVGHPANPYPYSIPGPLQWERIELVDGMPFDPPTLEGWYDPNTDSVVPNDHVPYWRYDFVNIPDAFPQIVDSIYWLNISAVLEDAVNYQWGWKNSRDHFMDDAVWTDVPGGIWVDMYEPPRVNNFGAIFNEFGEPYDTGSTNYYGSGWYPYEYWWNIWFYDNPFVYQPKEIHVEFDVMPWGTGPPALEFAINWSTEAWSDEGTPGRPPLPGEDEVLYIGREVIGVLEPLGHYVFPLTLPYNPEWVSIDFRAQNVLIYNGRITHECVQTSMDMAFVITGEGLDFGDDPDPTYPTQLASEGARHTIVPGIFLGSTIDPEPDGQPTATALGDDNDGNDDEDGVVFLSLATPGNPVTVKVTASAPGMLDAWVDFNGDGDWFDAGEQIFNSTALAAGSNVLTFNVPTSAVTNTTYSRFRFSTVGGLGVNGLAPDGEVEDYRVFIQEPIEDAKMHWPQLPDLDSTGMDVDMFWVRLADDWMCTDSGPVTDIHLWGSFADDILPRAGVGSLTFWLAIHANIPAGVVAEWSMPGEVLWSRTFYPGEYEVHQKADNNPEDWYDPTTQLWLNDNHLQVYQYNFYIDTTEAFVQDSGTIYWLSVKDSLPEQPDYTFGWKTTEYDLRWMDDACWLADPPSWWMPLTYPVGHEYRLETLDLAFVITGGAECPCGDCNGDGRITVADAIYIVSYIYRGGPGMVCNCDVNLDGRLTVADAIYIVSYIYRGGPPPCQPSSGVNSSQEKRRMGE